ncbi:Z1 domain-containing protein [Spongiibacter marinus]|uniref:Z1 domain-containing protein n=1 Tax=Spongiibacter marinus TaxID=354246 RepID=UPI0004119B64|nr:Z1 domain-containing protein [Spongiibacter marinus]
MSTYANVKLIATGQIEEAKNLANGQLTLELIKEKVNWAISAIPGATEKVDAAKMIAEFERDYHTYVGEALTLQSDEDGWEPWLNKAKADIDWAYWTRYRTHLLRNENYPKTVVDKVDEVTDETLNYLQNPKAEGPWDRRGMVVGHVQSGKTTNYSGLICKAADAGYKVIIVLTGFHNNLRTQTQIRLEEAFVGYDITTADGQLARTPVGVGHISSDPSLRVDTITNRSETGDFNRTVANNFSINPGGRPLVFVIKKNASVLKNLVKYLEYVANDKDKNGNPHISKVPLLLIDDEADQGSVDTAKLDVDAEGDPDPDHEPTTLNRLIRKILFIFSESAYVAYTATPFANVFIHNEIKSDKYGEDLFPRSFITTIPTPSNYIGPEKVFGLIDDDGEERRPGLPIVRPISDYAVSTSLDEKSGWMPPKHDRNHVPMHDGSRNPPPSLREAVLAFILGCTIRALRGQEHKHNSMLVHVTRFTDVQERVYEQLNSLMRDFKEILAYGEEGSRDTLLVELKALWEKDFLKTNEEINDLQCPPSNWADVSAKIFATAQSINVRRINGTAGDVLDYEQNKAKGLNVIAVGGDKLSRGLTLEGLIVSYFTRPSRMYDTLMQMGRWFGYRDGFIDICRLYAPDSLINWFQHITDASEELRNEFVLMKEMGESPATYGQRVRSHPVLMVTSQVKMRHSVELTLSYQGAISESIVYSRAGKDVDSNFSATAALIERIDSYADKRYAAVRHDNISEPQGKYLWSNVKPEEVLEYLQLYVSPSQHARKVNTALLAEYIEKQIANGDLTNWSVMLAGKATSESKSMINIGGISTGLIKRANHPNYSKEPSIEPNAFRIRRLVSPSDESWDLTQGQYDEALALAQNCDKSSPGGPELRTVRNKDNAHLIIYPLETQDYTQPIDSDKPYIGFAISFPGIKKDKPVTYRVDRVYQGQIDD